MAQQRGELVLLELEAKALEAVDVAWADYKSQGTINLIPTKLVTLVVEVHKMVMQRMNAKYGLDGTVTDLKNIRDALKKEVELVDKMIEQESAGLQ